MIDNMLTTTEEIVHVVDEAFAHGHKACTLADDYRWITGRLTAPWEAYVPSDAIRYSLYLNTHKICEALRKQGYHMTLWIGESSVYVIAKVKFEGDFFIPHRDLMTLLNS